MSDFALKLDTPNVIHVYQNRIASFSLKQEIYTPYTQLSVVGYASISLDTLKDVFRVRMELNGQEVHCGTVEQLRMTRENGAVRFHVVSKGMTAMLLQNQLAPKLYTGMSLDRLMTEFHTLPSQITWERSTDTSNYLFVKEGCSMWDGIANLTYKLHQRYPFIRGANEVRMNLPTQYTSFHFSESTVVGVGIGLVHSRMIRDFYMADTDGSYDNFHETDSKAQSLGIVRSRYLPLDRQYLYDPQQALTFRRKFAARGRQYFFVNANGILSASLGDRISYENDISNAVITGVQITGGKNGIRTHLEAYEDEFYP